MLNLSAIADSVVCDDPFRHLQMTGLLSAPALAALLRQKPDTGYWLNHRSAGTDKTYRVINNVLQPLGRGMNTSCILAAPWHELLADLNGEAYRRALGARLGLDLCELHLEVTLKYYDAGHYISPHTDRAGVPATHLLFFNPHWENAWGGMLCLLDRHHRRRVCVPPYLGTSLAFRQSSSSWHEVTPVAASAPPRMALQIAFWREAVHEPVRGRASRPVAALQHRVAP